MYAILQQSGHQYRVSPGDRLLVDRLAAEVGSVVALEPVVLVQGDEGSPTVGTPVVDGVRVAAVVVSHRKGAKIRVFKYKPKKHYRRTHGHRSLLTELRVEAVLAAGEALPKPQAAEEPSTTPRTRSRSRAKAEAAVAPEAIAEVETPAVTEVPEVETEAVTEAPAEATAAEDVAAEDVAAAAPKPRKPRTKKPAEPSTEPEA